MSDGTTTPVYPQSASDIKHILAATSLRLRKLERTEFLPFPSFSPADGIVTPERVAAYRSARHAIHARKAWHDVSTGRINEAARLEKELPQPEFCIAGETEKCEKWREGYARCMRDGFKFNPYDNPGAPKERWNEEPEIRLRGWAGKAVERDAPGPWLEPRWSLRPAIAGPVNLEDELDLGPEEDFVDGKVKVVETWRRADERGEEWVFGEELAPTVVAEVESQESGEGKERAVPEAATSDEAFSDSGYSSRKSSHKDTEKGAAAKASTTKWSIIRRSTAPAGSRHYAASLDSLTVAYLDDIKKEDAKHPFHLRRRVSNAVEGAKVRVTLLKARRSY